MQTQTGPVGLTVLLVGKKQKSNLPLSQRESNSVRLCLLQNGCAKTQGRLATHWTTTASAFDPEKLRLSLSPVVRAVTPQSPVLL